MQLPSGGIQNAPQGPCLQAERIAGADGGDGGQRWRARLMREDEDVPGLACRGLGAAPVVQGVPRGASGLLPLLPAGALEGGDHSSGLGGQPYRW